MTLVTLKYYRVGFFYPRKRKIVESFETSVTNVTNVTGRGGDCGKNMPSRAIVSLATCIFFIHLLAHLNPMRIYNPQVSTILSCDYNGIRCGILDTGRFVAILVPLFEKTSRKRQNS